MKKTLIFFVLVLLLSGPTFIACSNNKRADSEKGTIDKMTDKVAKEAIDKIRVPIEQAHVAKKLQTDRFSAMDDSTKSQ